MFNKLQADVMKTRSTENLPLPLCVAGLFVSAQRFLYGLLVGDNYIKVYFLCFLPSFLL